MGERRRTAALTAEQLGRLLQVPTSTIYDLAAKGRLDPRLVVIRAGRQIRFSRAGAELLLGADQVAAVLDAEEEGPP